MSLLSGSLEEALNLNTKQKEALQRLGLRTVRDLLFYFPSRYEDFSSHKKIVELSEGEIATVTGTIASAKTKKMFRRRVPLAEAFLEDSTGKIKAIWFNQPYIVKALPEGALAQFSGSVHKGKKGDLFFVNPVYEARTDDSGELFTIRENGRPFPVYPETRGLSSRWFQFQVEKILPLAANESDPIPPEILKSYSLPAFQKAIVSIHRPENLAWATAARKRFAFEEIFLIQLDRMRRKKLLESEPSFLIPEPAEKIRELTGRLPFPLTGAQERAAKQILEDFAQPHPMARLLEGDVGSGKTLVAVIAALAVKDAGYQAAYMAPTEILARQHFEEFSKQLKPFRATMGLITSSECRKFPSKVMSEESTHISRSQLLRWVKDGSIDILVGTHALIQKDVAFKHLALVIVDEQHRFGVQQRAKLVARGSSAERRTSASVPHLLSMTATPIPRTLALTIYGDLNLSLLDEMPKGRTKPLTRIIPPNKREEAYTFIEENIENGGQCFIICPKIQQNEDAKKQTSDTKAVKEEYARLKKDVFPDIPMGMLHGKMTPKEKESVVLAFKNKETKILVSTSVIEVGIDIPNASVIVIEGAERFGLASLHQFRGRVGRAGQQSYCFLFTDSKNEKTLSRLEALVKAKNGFELAEYDLALRGPGELSGTSQWGISDLGMEALKNIKMVEAAREEARKLIEEDPELKKYPLLSERTKQTEQRELHFE